MSNADTKADWKWDINDFGCRLSLVWDKGTLCEFGTLSANDDELVKIAELFRAAPALLQACKDSLSMCEHSIACDCSICEIYESIKAAIEKAEGTAK